MTASANIATHPERRESLRTILPSLLRQFDVVRVYLNEYDVVPDFLQHEKIVTHIGENITSNGKFYWADKVATGEIYCTCDDDIIYPPDYLEVVKARLSQYRGSIISFHGRRLWHGEPVGYYHTHGKFSFSGHEPNDRNLDIPGTGVMAYEVGRFKVSILDLPYPCMTDVQIGYLAACQGVSVVGIAHSVDFFGNMGLSGIYERMSPNDEVQS